jgi:hypothetical protein
MDHGSISRLAHAGVEKSQKQQRSPDERRLKKPLAYLIFINARTGLMMNVGGLGGGP